tara:strand:+ start:57 stop:638 length:582 start_codon:yes stop_codon:yes gene_type:complete
MACKKYSPTVVVTSISLQDYDSDGVTIARVTVDVEEMNSFRSDDEKLKHYIKVHFILSNLDSSSTFSVEDSLSPTEALHLSNAEWYKASTLVSKLSGQKEDLGSTDEDGRSGCVFNIDISKIVTSTNDGETWSCSNMSFFAYVQIDAQQMASDYEITVPEMAGNYTTGVVLEDDERPYDQYGSDSIVLDYRDN